MAFQGWLSFAGTEVVNAARTYAYATNMLPMLGLQDCYDCGDLAAALGDKEYTSPLVDQPDWFDPSDQDTWGFFGLYPLSIEGLDDSPATATVNESIGDGGYVSGIRRGTREIKVTGLLVGVDDAAVSAGMAWLKLSLSADECSTAESCSGDHLCFFQVCPEVCDPVVGAPMPQSGGLDSGVPIYLCPSGKEADPVDYCVLPYERHLYRVSRTDGPHLTQEYNVDCGAMWEVEFTLVAGVPWTYGPPIFALDASRDDATDSSLVTGAASTCAVTPQTPLADPDCPPSPAPPRPPIPAASCLDTPDVWRRYQYMIEGQYVEQIYGAVPTISIITGSTALRQARLRFYPDPLGWTSLTDPDNPAKRNIDECAYCGEFLISYIPPNSEMDINGITQQATVESKDEPTVALHQREVFPANHLLYGSDGGPMDWPLLTCGIPYLMTLDVVPDSAKEVQIKICLATRAG